jgi:cell pole-organizing protein PopZ
MGDVSAEPSMEDILSSIKRIIAEEGDDRPIRPRRNGAVRAVAPAPAADDEHGEGEEVLELSDPMPPTRPRATTTAPSSPPQPVAEAAAIVSDQTAQATRGALDALSRMLVKPEPASDGTLEGLVREMLRPMLREWLDTNLPGMVESLVAREIAKITRGA